MQRFSGWTRRDLLQHAALSLPALAGWRHLAFAAGPPEPAPPAAGPPRDPLEVIVVGAGLAGLAAAFELVALGHVVTVLEARLRPGGRVHTLREPFAEGLYAEAGAMAFTDGYRHLVRYLKTFDLVAEALTGGAPTGGALNVVYHLRGKRLTAKQGSAPDIATWPFNLTAEEQGLGVKGMFRKFFGVVAKIGDPTDPNWRLDPFKSYDAITTAELLRRQGASGEAVALLGDSLWFGYGWSSGSALHRLLSDLALFYLGQTTMVIRGGSDLLPKAFAASLGNRIRYGSPVVGILQQPGRVRAVFQPGGAGAEQTLDADCLLCTVPSPALRKVRFGPELGASKRRIIARLEYTPVTRIYLQAKRRSWRDAGDAGDAFTDLPIGQVAEQPLVRPAGQGPRGILECHIRGPEAERIAAMERAAQIGFALQGLENVHPGFKREFEIGTSVAWGADPWAGGGYAWWQPGQLTEWVPELAAPEGRVHFAGEHTSLLGRTMEGALESGNRAAREIHELARRSRRPAG